MDLLQQAFYTLILLLGHSILSCLASSHSTDNLEISSKRGLFRSSFICPDICSNGLNCNLDICTTCEFECKNVCKIPYTTDPSLDNESTSSCQLGSFVDVTRTKFLETDEYWYSWHHSGLPYQHFTSPLFVDFNGDNVLDYFNPMHAHELDEREYDRMELAESVPFHNSRNETSVLEAGGNDISMFHLRSISSRITINDYNLEEMDMHGANILDLDNDGINDIFISSGGGRGTGDEDFLKTRDNFLLWGQRGFDEITGKPTTFFRGGRDTARAAGVHMRYGRGRMNYMFDANGDGLMDIFCFQSRRVGNELAPGILLINQGNRTWREESSMSEYARAALLTDVDGDGIAQEFVMNRAFCFPQRSGPEAVNTDPELYELGPYPENILEFCKTRPVGSTAIYKYNKNTNKMEDISNKIYYNISPNNEKQPDCCPNGSWDGWQNCNALNIESGDFDGDQLADHIFLYQSKMVFYFSTDRPSGKISIGAFEHRGAEIYFPQNKCKSAISLQLVDLDNDGKEEILVMCRHKGQYLVYSHGIEKDDWTLNNDCNYDSALGDFMNASLVELQAQNYLDWCSEDTPTTAVPGLNSRNRNYFCDQFGKWKQIQSGVSVIDLNNDGFPDLVTASNWGFVKMYQNVPSASSEKNRFIAFKLEGNAYGIGATVILHENRSGKVQTQFREISTYQHTSGTSGYKDDRLIFGLGETGVPKYLLVRWGNGDLQKYWIGKDWQHSKEMKVINVVQTPPCNDFEWQIFEISGKQKSCSWLNAKRNNIMINICNRPDLNARMFCPGVCAKACKCKDNPSTSFKFHSNKEMSCLQISAMTPNKRRRQFCKNNPIAQKMCPDSCLGWCLTLLKK